MANELKTVLRDELETVKSGLPANFNIQRFVNNAVALLYGNETLQKFANANPNGIIQIKNGLMRGAYLDLDALRHEFYLIPYGNKLDFRIDYRGEQKLAKKYSIRPIRDIYAKIVRQGDDFDEKIVNGAPTIDFKPMPFNESPIVGVFAVCLFEDGGMIYEVMSKKEIDACEAKSQKSGAWRDFYGEMAKKSCIRRLMKAMTIEFENPEQLEIFNEDMGMNFDRPNIQEEAKENANSEDFIIEGEYEETDDSDVVTVEP